MNLANLAISITAIDATRNTLLRMTDNFRKTAKEVTKLWQEGKNSRLR